MHTSRLYQIQFCNLDDLDTFMLLTLQDFLLDKYFPFESLEWWISHCLKITKMSRKNFHSNFFFLHHNRFFPLIFTPKMSKMYLAYRYVMRLFDLFSNICEFTTYHTKDISLELQDTSTATVNERKVFCNSREETLTLPE